MPSCIHITLIPFFFIASITTTGTSSDLLKTSTTSTSSGISDMDGYDFLPSTSVMVGFTGITLYPRSIRYLGTSEQAFLHFLTFLLLQYFLSHRFFSIQNQNVDL